MQLSSLRIKMVFLSCSKFDGTQTFASHLMAKNREVANKATTKFIYLALEPYENDRVSSRKCKQFYLLIQRTFSLICCRLVIATEQYTIMRD